MAKKAKTTVATRSSSGGFRVSGVALSIMLSVAVPTIGGFITYFTTAGRNDLRLNMVEKWQEDHRTIDGDLSTIRATLENVKDKLGSIDNAVGKIGDRMSRNPSWPGANRPTGEP